MGMYDAIVGTRRPDGGRLGNTEMWDRLIGETDQAGRTVAGMQSGFEGLNSAGDVAGRFGLDERNIEAKYNPARRNLSTQLARSRSSLAARQGANTAIPEAGFNQLEGQFAGAFGDLEGAAAGEKVNQQRLIASILERVIGQRDNFGLAKNSLYSRILGDRGSQMNAMMDRGDTDREAEGSFLQDAAGVVGLGGSILGLPTGAGGMNLASSLFGGGKKKK